MRYSSKVLGILWAIVVIAAAIYLAVRARSSLSLESDLLALLPKGSHQAVAQHAEDTFLRELGQRLFVLIGARDFSDAAKATNSFEHSLLNSGLFSGVASRLSVSQESYHQLFFPYREFLYGKDVRTILEGSSSMTALVNRSAHILYTPLTGQVTSDAGEDPLFLFVSYLAQLPKPPGAMQLHEGYLTVQREGKTFVFLQAKIGASVFSRDTQRAASRAVTEAESAARAQVRASEYLYAGALPVATAMAAQAEHDVRLVSLGSTVGCLLLVALAFGSLTPLCMSAAAVLVGILFAVVACSIVFPAIHVLTLGFGASLIGVCTDYPLYFFSHRASQSMETSQQIVRRILPAMNFAALTTVLGYVGLFLAPFPGLRQMATFAVVGVTASCLTVVFWFPNIPPPRHAWKIPIVYTIAAAWNYLCTRRSVRLVTRIALVFSIPFIATILPQLKVNDDVRLLQSPPAALKQQEESFSKAVGGLTTSRFFLVSGDTEEQVLERSEEVLHLLSPMMHNGALSSMQSISQFVPSLKRQRENVTLLQTAMRQADTHFVHDLLELGFSEETIRLTQARIAALNSSQGLTISTWLSSPASAGLRSLWLGMLDGKQNALISFNGSIPNQEAKQLIASISGVYLIDKPGEVSLTLATYRRYATQLIALFYGAIYLFFVLRYGLRQGSIGMIPSLFAVVFSLTAQALLAQPITLFSILATVIMLGVAVDYAIFSLEQREQEVATTMAIALSAMSTMLSFGLLAASQTAVLRSFGVTLFVGIVTAMILTPLLLSSRQLKR